MNIIISIWYRVISIIFGVIACICFISGDLSEGNTYLILSAVITIIDKVDEIKEEIKK